MAKEKVFDALLVLQYRSGNKKALGLLVKRHHHQMCRHSYSFTRDIDSSKDIVQDCWSIIINKIDFLKDPNVFGSWAMRIVTRKSLDFVNKRTRERQEKNTLPIEDENSSEEKRTIFIELQKAIAGLPQDQQTVLRLFYTQEYSLKEIASILDVSVGTVKSRLFHAREKLKTVLKVKKDA